MRLFPSSKNTFELELISIHIPKTAGTSFMEILRDVYGRNGLATLHIQSLGNDKWRAVQNDKPVELEDISIKGKVVHGHSSYSSFRQLAKLPGTVPIITWLRDPAKRVESAYHFANEIFKNELSESHPRLNILNSMKRNFMEYAASPPNRNVMHQMLEGVALEDLFFVGLVEHFEEDLAYLATKLGWKNFSVPHSNRTPARPPLAPFRREALLAWNQKDVALYEKALELRAKRK